MKLVIILSLVLMACSGAHPQEARAGGPSCSGTTSITSGASYLASSSDCLISVDKNYFEGTLIYLPNNPSVGDKFTIRENTTAKQCDVYEGEEYCWPANVCAETSDASILVDGVVENCLGDFHAQMELIYDGSEWAATYSYF